MAATSNNACVLLSSPVSFMTSTIKRRLSLTNVPSFDLDEDEPTTPTPTTANTTNAHKRARLLALSSNGQQTLPPLTLPAPPAPRRRSVLVHPMDQHHVAPPSNLFLPSLLSLRSMPSLLVAGNDEVTDDEEEAELNFLPRMAADLPLPRGAAWRLQPRQPLRLAPSTRHMLPRTDPTAWLWSSPPPMPTASTEEEEADTAAAAAAAATETSIPSSTNSDLLLLNAAASKDAGNDKAWPSPHAVPAPFASTLKKTNRSCHALCA